MTTRAAKRKREQEAVDAVVAYTQPCLLPRLQPVRHCLHQFLSDDDAVRLLRASRSTATPLLSGYAFLDHRFAFHTMAAVKRGTALFNHYRMRILRMSLPACWTHVGQLVDKETGQSLLPASLIALSLGEGRGTGASAWQPQDSMACAAIEWCEKSSEAESNRAVQTVGEAKGALADGAIAELVSECVEWDVRGFGRSVGRFQQSLPPGALPHGLRFLQLNSAFNRPLQSGSIPDSVEVLQLGEQFRQPLKPGHLPASLTHLVLGDFYNQPLLPGVLPAGLRRLRLGAFNYQPLSRGVLPSQLQQLSLGGYYNLSLEPGVIPAFVTHLRLGEWFNSTLR